MNTNLASHLFTKLLDLPTSRAQSVFFLEARFRKRETPGLPPEPEMRSEGRLRKSTKLPVAWRSYVLYLEISTEICIDHR